MLLIEKKLGDFPLLALPLRFIRAAAPAAKEDEEEEKWKKITDGQGGGDGRGIPPCMRANLM